MTPSIRLGGFKLLQEVTWISVTTPGRDKGLPGELSSLLAGKKTNLPFFTCGNEGWEWGLDLVIDAGDEEKTTSLLQHNFHGARLTTTRAVILSIFPHQGNPETLGTLLGAFGRAGVNPVAITNSHSSISVVLDKTVINKATSALFGPFSFSAYRSPADWKLAQKGKETLYREVVASYQEKRPKVYGLEWVAKQSLLRIPIKKHNLGATGEIFKKISQLGFRLTFLVTSPSKENNATNLFFCVPRSDISGCAEILKQSPGEKSMGFKAPAVASFSMNGPHFGDRYGIANDLIRALGEARVELLGLSCSIASISGVIPADQIHPALEAIRGCFEVPSIIDKTNNMG